MKELFLLLALVWALPLLGAAPDGQSAAGPPTVVTQETVDKLLAVIAAHEARIEELEKRLDGKASESGTADRAKPPLTVASPPAANVIADLAPPPPPVAPTPEPAEHDHMMRLPGGPTLNIKGFFDFNYGVGSIANPLVFPIVNDGCATCGNPVTSPHNAFQAGEFDLFMTSKVSDHLSFLAEVVLGPNATNLFGVDIERYEMKYRANRYFSASLGRMHTSIGYYNTAYHHGDWFSTAEGRPIMYLFEDSGGILPVHLVGLSFAGEVPHTEKLGLHWTAEIGNGLSSNSNVAESVQNFYSDRNYKATNLAMYIRPQFVPGLQIGGSWYHDGLNPTGLPEVRQNIESAYVVFLTPTWELLNEAVMLSNHLSGAPAAFRSPMAYTQIARAFGIYKPYFRYQYVHDNVQDPVNLLQGKYYGPSIGLRIDFWDYAAFKLQYNHLFQSNQLAGNGLDAQLAFTF